MSVRRAGLITSRRTYAQAIEAMTMSATTFCMALTAAQMAPSSGDRQDRLDDAAGHDVRRADGQQHEAPEDPGVHQAGSRVLEHLGLDERVLDQADQARRNVCEWGGGPRRREHAQVAGHGQGEERCGAPEDREDERIGRNVGERLEHQLCGSPWAGRVTP